MIFQILILLLPWSLRRRLLVWRYGWELAPSSHIGISLIQAKHLIMGPYSRIHNLACCRRIDKLELGEDAGIASLTYITGVSVDGSKMYQHVADRKCELILGKSAGITSRHYIDCNGGVYIGDYTTIAGIRSQILTHSIDIYTNRQDAKPVIVGKYCFVGTGCILLPGCSLPSYSVLGAGAVLTMPYNECGYLYAGVPAKPVKKLAVDNIPYFHRDKHFVN